MSRAIDCHNFKTRIISDKKLSVLKNLAFDNIGKIMTRLKTDGYAKIFYCIKSETKSEVYIETGRPVYFSPDVSIGSSIMKIECNGCKLFESGDE